MSDSPGLRTTRALASELQSGTYTEITLPLSSSAFTKRLGSLDEPIDVDEGEADQPLPMMRRQKRNSGAGSPTPTVSSDSTSARGSARG